MITNTKTLSSAQTAIVLWQNLGPLRVWPDFLSDCIRYRQDINGFTLLPCARKKNGRVNSPMYSARDVNQFIKDVKSCTLHAGPAKMAFTTLAIDDSLPWRLNKFDKHGAPTGRKCSIYPAGAGAGYGAAARKPTTSRWSGGLSAPYTH
jgi:glycerol kinase